MKTKKVIVRRELWLWGVIVGLLIWVGWLTLKNNYAPRVFMITGGEGGGTAASATLKPSATPKPSAQAGRSKTTAECRQTCSDLVEVPTTGSWRERLDKFALRTYCIESCQKRWVWTAP